MVEQNTPMNHSDGKQDDEAELVFKPQRPIISGITFIVLESAAKLLASSYDSLLENGHLFIFEETVHGTLKSLDIGQFDLIILEADAKSNILSMCSALRQETELPILLVTLPDNELHAVRAVANSLVDNYLCAPVNTDALLANIRKSAKALRRPSRHAAPIQIGDLQIDFARRKVYLGSVEVILTTHEYDVLRLLVWNRYRTLSHEQLLSHVWGPEYRQETQYLWVTMSRLRRKLQPNQDSERYIFNEPRVGYRFREE